MKRSIMMGLSLGVFVQVSMGLGVLGPASAYDTVVVKDGAVLRGTMTFQGKAPAPKEFELRRYPDQVFCGALSDGDGHRFLKEVHVGQGGGLKDVVVVVEGSAGREAVHLYECPGRSQRVPVSSLRHRRER